MKLDESLSGLMILLATVLASFSALSLQKHSSPTSHPTRSPHLPGPVFFSHFLSFHAAISNDHVFILILQYPSHLQNAPLSSKISSFCLCDIIAFWFLSFCCDWSWLACSPDSFLTNR